MASTSPQLPVSEEYKLATSVDDVPLTSAVLAAGARHVGEFCAKENLEFLRCKFQSEGDPKPCLEKGAKVTLCAFEFFKQLQTNCSAAFTAQWKCLDEHNQLYERCRKTQAALDQCALDKMGLKGHFKTFDTPLSGSSYDD